ncbi:hypothetical protein OSB04_010229 [Centaurea solstitialis]|uniref:Uncharacterized protein n=1 Tax=Centaurea solstitialis TaxID=347529 RepID=A0AA38T749_9ASTR|nr:hypothetical protein OSB04_010229 [Centaurea solstitialis]
MPSHGRRKTSDQCSGTYKLKAAYEYSLIGSFMDFFEGLTYEHVNFIFSDVTYPQESAHYTLNPNAYKFAYSEPGVSRTTIIVMLMKSMIRHTGIMDLLGKWRMLQI